MISGSCKVEEIETRASFVTCPATNISHHDKKQQLRSCNAALGVLGCFLCVHVRARNGCKVTFSSIHPLSPDCQGPSRCPGELFPQLMMHEVSISVQGMDGCSSLWTDSITKCAVHVPDRLKRHSLEQRKILLQSQARRIGFFLFKRPLDGFLGRIFIGNI